MLPSHFFANLARMRLIYRWPLMRNIQPENIAEHSLQVAMVAHALGVISNRLFDGKVDANHAAGYGWPTGGSGESRAPRYGT